MRSFVSDGWKQKILTSSCGGSDSSMADEDEKPAVAPPVFVCQKDKAQKRSAEGSSSEDGEDSDTADGDYNPAAKRGRTSSFTQFPPTHFVSKNNVFMPSSFCQSPTENSDSEPEEKTVGFRLKPPTLIHGQAPSAGVPSPKPKEAQRSILRPPVLQPPPARSPPQNTDSSDSSSNGAKNLSDGGAECERNSETSAAGTQDNDVSPVKSNSTFGHKTEDKTEGAPIESSFVFGQNMRDRAKVANSCLSSESGDSEEINYFLQYITSSAQKPDSSDANSVKFVFGQNMLDRVLALPKFSTEPPGSSKEPQSEMGLFSQISSSHDQTVEKSDNMKESLEESAARHEAHKPQKCLLEQVEVRTGEESESNVLQMQCKLFVFEMTSQSWVERGCGVLRLNDMASADDGTLQSRLVMRTQGSLRVILNTKLWPQMQVDKASEKSLRITAMDTEEQGVKVFLISSSSKDAAQLFAALHHRILALRSISGQESDGQPAIRFSDDDESRTPPTAATPAPGNPEAGVCPSTGDT
ncbi:ran-binding protein 3-like isoform X1 [Sinocyclocheilus grahami]|uniref:ran-binding protein 3-like isoform X1 n=2 Tax=Sinocyclocheilus grahami TaxID=75366 RepID=UPI0007AD0004|nr:PREDICTED: ran-binding protein 3-like isoform X1 [Sinocyclocheilus grahami]